MNVIAETSFTDEKFSEKCFNHLKKKSRNLKHTSEGVSRDIHLKNSMKEKIAVLNIKKIMN